MDDLVERVGRSKPVPMDVSEELLARFWQGVEVRGPDECWEWRKPLVAGSYGRLLIDGEWFFAHRLSLSWDRGQSLAADELCCHRCDNPPCVNPSHLFAGSHRQNMDDAIAKGRTHKWEGARAGEKNPRAKLNAEQVIAIRADDRSLRQIARDYGLGYTTVRYLKRGLSWQTV